MRGIPQYFDILCKKSQDRLILFLTDIRQLHTKYLYNAAPPKISRASTETHYPKGSGDKSFIMGVWSRDNCFNDPPSVLTLPRACDIKSYQGVVKLKSMPP